MTTYLAGPMTGLPEFNYPAFDAAAKVMRDNGAHVLNPAENTCHFPNPTWSDYMRMGLLQLLRCDTIAMLPGWERSRGARIEHQIAVDVLGMDVIYLSEDA